MIWKFPFYTCMTFGVRTIRQNLEKNNKYNIEEHIIGYLNHWTKDDDGRVIIRKKIEDEINKKEN
jgi:hypothetical protein